jgi:hypothetical protein
MIHALYRDLETKNGRTPVLVCLQHMSTSLAQVFMGEADSLELPKPMLDVDALWTKDAIGIQTDVDYRDV